jgi:hypothetical protein
VHFLKAVNGTVTLGEKKMEIHNKLHHSLVRRSVTYWMGQRLLCLECYAVSIPETPVIGWQMFGCDERIQPNYHLEMFFVWTTYIIGVPKSNTMLLTCTVRTDVCSSCICWGTHTQCTLHSNVQYNNIVCNGLNVAVKWVTFLLRIPNMSGSNLDTQIGFSNTRWTE